MEKVAILGASRGLGKSLVGALGDRKALLVSRKEVLLKGLCEGQENLEYFACDLSHDEGKELCEKRLNEYQPSKVLLVLGGGPYGPFQEKSWKDHMWAYQVTLLTPAFFTHWAMNSDFVDQLVLVGSEVAEEKADPFAASYCSAKHGLKGLHSSICAENRDFDLRLYSPGYMDTAMLPVNAQPRLDGQLSDPDVVAKDLIEWSDSGDFQGHRKYK